MHEGDRDADILIAGCGAAGLYAALNLPRSLRVTMLSKGAVEECDSMLAQGGICVLPDDADFEAFFEDTMRAGHYENRRESVEIMIRSSQAVIGDLLACGVAFERDASGGLAFTREGAHTRPRICYHADTTGREITTRLLAAVRALPNVRILEHVAMVDLIVEGGACAGVMARRVAAGESHLTAGELREGASSEHAPFPLRAAATVLATGGIGGLYERSTNYPQLTGDACLLAAERGIALEHLDYVQIHPTGLYDERPGRTFLISESCRVEGAVLLNQAGERFTDELAPRDVVAAAIREQMRRDRAPFEWLSFAPVSPDVIRGHFGTIRAHCLEALGRDILTDPIPVVPTQHYFMGGVAVDADGATSMPGLYAVGETACNGVHGRNRLASNSLLEALVWARRAAWRIATGTSLPPDGRPGAVAGAEGAAPAGCRGGGWPRVGSQCAPSGRPQGDARPSSPIRPASSAKESL